MVEIGCDWICVEVMRVVVGLGGCFRVLGGRFWNGERFVGGVFGV